MIKILIIEDEIPARKKLKRFLDEINAEVKIIAEIDTVESSIVFLKNNTPDLIFSDIKLLDGNSFEIYNQIVISCPIIFTTAYDQFLMDAFDTNGIAYLLKPFSQERFLLAWEKFILLRKSPSDENVLLKNISQIIEQSFCQKQFKKRFSVNSYNGIYFLETENIFFFQADEGVVFAYDNLEKKHLLSENTLKEIELQLDPAIFFRLNRSELVNKNHIEKIERYSKNTMSVKLKGYKNFLVTSQSNTARFRNWIEE